MIRITVQLPEGQLEAARAQARLQGLSLACFVRHAIDVQIVRSESQVRLVRRRALTAVDKVEAVPPPGAAPSGGGQPGAGVPRYWLDHPLDDE
jgi:hypothetical protein